MPRQEKIVSTIPSGIIRPDRQFPLTPNPSGIIRWSYEGPELDENVMTDMRYQGTPPHILIIKPGDLITTFEILPIKVSNALLREVLEYLDFDDSEFANKATTAIRNRIRNTTDAETYFPEHRDEQELLDLVSAAQIAGHPDGDRLQRLFIDRSFIQRTAEAIDLNHADKMVRVKFQQHYAWFALAYLTAARYTNSTRGIRSSFSSPRPFFSFSFLRLDS